MSKFWFSSVLLVFAVLCKNYVMIQAHPGHTTDCDQLVLIDSEDECKLAGNFSFRGDCGAFFECSMEDGNTTGYRRDCDQGNIFNGSHCVPEPEDDKTKQQVCPELKCKQTSTPEGRDDIPHGLHESTESPSTTAKPLYTTAKPLVQQSTVSPSAPAKPLVVTTETTTPRSAKSSSPLGGNEVRPQMMFVSCVLLLVLHRIF